MRIVEAILSIRPDRRSALRAFSRLDLRTDASSTLEGAALLQAESPGA